MLIPKHSEFRGRANSEARNETERDGIPRKNEGLRNSLNTVKNDFNQGGGNQFLRPLQELPETLSHGLYDHSDGLYSL